MAPQLVREHPGPDRPHSVEAGLLYLLNHVIPSALNAQILVRKPILIHMDRNLDRVFLQFSVDKLGQLAGRIGDCLERLSYDQVWSRGSENENAVGNLVLHLCGNLGQWIGAGVAGAPDTRVREREFLARGEVQPGELRERLAEAVAGAVEVIRELPSERLSETINVQDYDVTVLEAIYHVVEHFAQHAAQIMFATKMMTGEGLGYYGHLGKGAGHGETTP